MRVILVTLFTTLLTPVALAQTAGIELVVPKRTLELGESIQIDLVCRNMDRPDTPAAAVPKGLDLKLLNPNASSSIRIVNGVSSSKYTFSMTLTAKELGTHILGAITVRAGGKTYQTQPMRFAVKETQMAGDRGDRFLFAELEVNPRKLFVTQAVTATLTIGIREVVIGGRRYSLNLLRDVLDVRGSQLSVFANGRADQSTITLVDSGGTRHRYQVFRVTLPLRAETVGPMHIGPVLLKANYPTAIRDSFFRPSVRSARTEFARADEIVVDVKVPPIEGRPADYTGAIGRFKMFVDAKPTEVDLGRPITLTVSVVGDNVEGVAGPDLSHCAELASRFDFTKDEWLGDTAGSRKVFRRAVFPKQDGPQHIPAISWSYFDPVREVYETLTSQPIAIQVRPSAAGADSFAIGEVASSQPRATQLKVLAGGLSPNYVNVDELLADTHSTPGSAWTSALASPPLIWLLLAIYTFRRRRLQGDAGLSRRRRAARRVGSDLNNALRLDDPNEQWAAIGVALQRYLANRFNLPPGEITPQDARQLLADRAKTQPIAEAVASLLDRCGAMRFAPGEGATSSVTQAAADIKDWVRLIERARP